MADKVNMSLDEIIKLNKKTSALNAKKAGGTPRGKFPAKKAGAMGGRNRFRGAARPQGRVNNNNGKAATAGRVDQRLVKKLVNKAVKQIAAKQAVSNRGGIRGKLPRNITTTSARLARIQNQSRVIQRQRVVAPAGARIVQRGRGFAGRFARPTTNVVERIIERPVIVQQQAPIRQQKQQPQIVQVVRPVQSIRKKLGRQQQQQRVMVVQQSPIGRVHGRGGRFIRLGGGQRVIQQQTLAQPRIIQRQRAIRQQQPQIIYEEDYEEAPVVRQPRVIMQKFRQPVRQQQVQYVVRQAGGGGRAAGNAFRAKNNQFRNALQIGRPAQRVQVVDRFEPSSSFLSRTVVKKGRGFRQF